MFNLFFLLNLPNKSSGMAVSLPRPESKILLIDCYKCHLKLLVAQNSILNFMTMYILITYLLESVLVL